MEHHFSNLIRYKYLKEIIDIIKPKSILEVGTSAGYSANYMLFTAQLYNTVSYLGFDVFDTETKEFHKQVLNAKPPISKKTAQENICKELNPETSVQLLSGKTSKTLHNKHYIADLAFIDGDHRIETIVLDYMAIIDSKVIIFDDYYIGDIDTTKYGCNEIIKDRINSYVLPNYDKFKVPTSNGPVEIHFAIIINNSEYKKELLKLIN